MSLTSGLLRRFQQRTDVAAEAFVAPLKQTKDVTQTKLKASLVKATTPDVPHLLEAVNGLSPLKQAKMYEMLPEPEIALDNGLKVTIRSKKERRRFTRSIDANMLGWLGALAPGDVFYDVGANCGSLTLTAAAMHREGLKIVAIEPGFANFESLARNLSHNGLLGFVIPLQVALLDGTRLEPINYHSGTGAGTSLHAVGLPVDHEGNEFVPFETQMVPVYALDDLIDILKLPEPTHVKIDVDGTEGPLLQGATRTLARGSVREVLVEIVDHDRAGTRLSSIQSLFEHHGYELAETYSHHTKDTTSFVADHLFRRKAPAENHWGSP